MRTNSIVIPVGRDAVSELRCCRAETNGEVANIKPHAVIAMIFMPVE